MNISDKVVCVDDFRNHDKIRSYPNGYVKSGEVYVVSGSYSGWDGNGLYLVGKPIEDPRFPPGHCSWNATRFRLLSEMKEEAKARTKKPKIITCPSQD